MTTHSTPTAQAAQLESYIATEFLGQPDEQIPADLDLLNSGILDSLGMLKLIAWIESTFDLTIADTDLDPANFRDLQSISDFVERAAHGQPVS